MLKQRHDSTNRSLNLKQRPLSEFCAPERSLSDDSSSDEDVLLSDDEGKTTGGGKKKKKPRRPQYDEARKKEIRETNKLAARECRARKKRLMSELEKTVGSLTAEHSALVKQNRELTIRLETLQRTVGPPPATAAAAGGLMGSSMSSTTPQLATVANSATSLLSGLGGGGQQSAMNNSLMMPNAAQMALLAQLNANTNPGFQNPQMLSQMLANNSMMMNLASNNNNKTTNTNTNTSNVSGSGSNCNTPSLSMGSVGTPKQIQFFPTSGNSATPSAGGTLTGGGANGAPPTTSASPGIPPLKQTAGNGQLPISMSNGGLTI